MPRKPPPRINHTLNVTDWSMSDFRAHPEIPDDASLSIDGVYSDDPLQIYLDWLEPEPES